MVDGVTKSRPGGPPDADFGDGLARGYTARSAEPAMLVALVI